MPSRFKKDIVAAACVSDVSGDGGSVRIEGMRQVLANIGVGDQIDTGDLRMIFQEVGNATGEISAKKFLQIL